MKPPVRYAKTVDGGTVAFAVAGHGYPLVDITAGTFCNVALQWETPGFAGWYEALAGWFTHVRFDPRGAPNSDAAPAGRKYADYILDDIDAVVTRLGLERVAMMAADADVQHMAEYAATRPGVVSHLIFVSPVTHPFLLPPEVQEIDWDAFQAERAATLGIDIETLWAQNWLGPSASGAQIEGYAQLARTNDKQKRASWHAKLRQRDRELDLAPFLPSLTQRTAITCSPMTMAAAKELATALPRSLLAVRQEGDPTVMVAVPGVHEETAGRAAQFIYGSENPVRPGGGLVARRGADELLASLTEREREILALVAAGHSNAEMGETLSVSPHTVTRHVANIYGKLGIHNRAQAAAAHFGVLDERLAHETPT